MKSKGLFQEAINTYSLIFKRRGIERKYQDMREQENKSWLPKLIVASIVIIIMGIFGYRLYGDYQMKAFKAFEAGVIGASMCVASPIMEVGLHYINRLKYFRGFIVNFGLTFGVALYNAQKTPTLSFVPGTLPVFFIAFYATVLFSYNWISAYVIAFLTQVATTSYFANRYRGTVPLPDLVVPLINYNLYMLVFPVFLYLLEKVKRQITYLSWENEKEMKFWKMLVNAIPVGIVIVYKKDLVYANKQLYNMFEIHGDERRKKELVIERMKKTHTRGSTHLDLASLLLSNPDVLEVVTEQKYFYQGLKGDDIPLAISTLEYKKAGEKYKICILQDQKLFEELEQEKVRAQYQKNFLAMVTHELRNPLHGIMGIIDIFRGQAKSEQLLHFCRVGTNAAKLMMSLVNDILDISQIEANKLSLIEDCCDFVEIAKECKDVMSLQFENKKLYLTLDANPPIPDICNDKRRYSQIVINLLSNALKFTTKGGITITISYDHRDDLLHTIVTDTGKGISEENVKKLFRMYERLNTAKDNPQGIGLGLLICQKLTEQMGGSIHAESKLGEGTSFHFTIKNKQTSPVRQQTERDRPRKLPPIVRETPMGNDIEEDKGGVNESIRVLLPRKLSTEDLEGKKHKSSLLAEVLIIDDDYSSAFILENVCTSLKAKVDVANCGEKGVEMVSKRMKESYLSEQYKFIFVDRNMPGMNGNETIAHIKQIYDVAHVKFVSVCVSGDSNQEAINDSKAAGIDEYLTKPFTKADIMRIFQGYFIT